MHWHDLCFLHWRVPADVLRPLVPSTLPIDTFDGSAWLGVIPFTMTGVRHRCLPGLPATSAFHELNVRTYVTGPDGTRPGVWFFSLDAASRLAVEVARRTFHLNYLVARMSLVRFEGWVRYASERTDGRGAPAAFRGRYRPAGDAYRPSPGTIEHFLTERYCLYAAAPSGRLFRGEIHHAPWLLRGAEASIETNSMVSAIGVEVASQPDLLHHAERMEVVAWRLTRCAS
jgi:hypothetical protein